MDRTKLKVIRMAMNKALEEVGKEFDMELTIGRMTYSERGFSAKVQADELTQDGGNAKYAYDWDMASRLGHVQKEWLGKFHDGYEIVGYDFNKPKNSIIYRKGGKQYNGKSDSLVRHMAKKALNPLGQKGVS